MSNQKNNAPKNRFSVGGFLLLCVFLPLFPFLVVGWIVFAPIAALRQKHWFLSLVAEIGPIGVAFSLLAVTIMYVVVYLIN